MIHLRRTKLVTVAVACIATGRAGAQSFPPGVIDAPPTVIGNHESIGSDTTLNVRAGGSIGYGFQAGDTTFSGLTTNVVVNIEGGRIGEGFWAGRNTSVIMSGGVVGRRFGGFFQDFELVGGDFAVDGVHYRETDLQLFSYNVLTGVLADGTPFIFHASDSLPRDIKLTTVAVPPGRCQSCAVDGKSPDAPSGLRSNESLLLLDGGSLLDFFAVVDSDISIEGGDAGYGLELAHSTATIRDGTVGYSMTVLDSTVDILGGAVGPGMYVRSHSTVNILGGTVGPYLDVFASTINILDGRIGAGLKANAGSVVNILGGVVGDEAEVTPYGTINLAGGNVGEAYKGSPYGITNIVGREFYLDGIELDVTSGAFLTVYRNVVEPPRELSGVLADGTPFHFDLNRELIDGQDYFDDLSLLNVTLVADPGDYNADGTVDLNDYASFTAMFGERVVPFTGADGNGDGVIDAADYSVWRDALAVRQLGVPEPAGLLLAVATLLTTATPRRSLVSLARLLDG